MKIHPKVLERIENNNSEIQHGVITLSIHMRDGHPRYKLGYEEWLNEFGGLVTQYDFYPEEKTDQNKKSDSCGSVKSVVRISRGKRNITNQRSMGGKN